MSFMRTGGVSRVAHLLLPSPLACRADAPAMLSIPPPPPFALARNPRDRPLPCRLPPSPPPCRLLERPLPRSSGAVAKSLGSTRRLMLSSQQRYHPKAEAKASARRSMPGAQVVSSLWASLGVSRSNQYPSRTDRTTRPFWFIREMRLSQILARHRYEGGRCPPRPRFPGPTAKLWADRRRTARPALAPSPPLLRLRNQRFSPRRAAIRTSFSILGSMRLALRPNGVSSRVIMLFETPFPLPPFAEASVPPPTETLLR
mmetsp:Transcript_15077/g.34958  ORF Transcript_15077/g.34958 Transcript_15077/m.34958 type:complete len:258 (+) Transcript_15077:1933-2706(+)